MAEMNEKKGVVFPEKKIILLNGKTLDCFPVAKADEIEVKDDNFKLDTTRRYFALGKRHLKPMPPTPPDVEAQRELFINNAFYLLAHKERIISDSRMFLCPIAVQSGLMYTGTSGFTRPTLGLYLEWWENCAGAMRTDKDGRRGLVYYLGGSPLTGANSSKVIYEDGAREVINLSSFSDYWRPFIKINRRYNEAKYQYQAYTLQEVLDILKKKDARNMDFSLIIKDLFMSHEIYSLTKRVKQLTSECDEWREKYYDLALKFKEEKICAFYIEYKDLEAKSKAEIEQIKVQKKELKAALKRGQMDNIAYQRQLTPLNKRIKELELEMSHFKFKKIHEFFPNENMNFYKIEEFIKKKNEHESI